MATVHVYQFDGGWATNQGALKPIHTITRLVHKTVAVYPLNNACASPSLVEQEYYWVLYAGTNYVVHRETKWSEEVKGWVETDAWELKLPSTATLEEFNANDGATEAKKNAATQLRNLSRALAEMAKLVEP